MMMYLKPLHEMNVLITGGSGGIGGAIANRFAQLGMGIIINYCRSYDKANDIARSCISQGARALTIRADVSIAAEIEEMQEKLHSYNMLPDLLIHNAGQSYSGLLNEMEEQQWDNLFAINVKSAFLLAKSFTPHMVRQKFGRIVNISSVWGISGGALEVAYSATKGALNAYTKALAKELAPSGITVNAVAPGAVDTPMLDHLDAEETNKLLDEIPAGRFAKPDEIAALVYFLCLPESGYINGQIISPNGAWLT